MSFDQIKQAMELKAKMDKIQKEMEKTIVVGEGGKGMIQVTMNGKMKVKSVKIDPSVIDPKNEKKLEEMVYKAIDDAVEKAQKEAEKQLKELTGGLKIPRAILTKTVSPAVRPEGFPVAARHAVPDRYQGVINNKENSILRSQHSLIFEGFYSIDIQIE